MADQRSEIAERYAGALFELASDEGQASKVEADLDALHKAYSESDDLKRLIASPAFSAEDKSAGFSALLDRSGAQPLTINFGKLLAKNGRLALLLDVISTFKRLAAEARNEVSADVVSAHPLSDEQAADLKTQLRASTGKEVNLNVRTDSDLLGGLIVKIGSRMIDSSLKTKLARMRARLKEA